MADRLGQTYSLKEIEEHLDLEVVSRTINGSEEASEVCPLKLFGNGIDINV